MTAPGWTEPKSITVDELKLQIANAMRKAAGLPPIVLPPACGCRGVVHTCGTII